MKMELTVCSETSAYKFQTLENNPEENMQHPEHGGSLKSRKQVWFPIKHFIIQLLHNI